MAKKPSGADPSAMRSGDTVTTGAQGDLGQWVGSTSTPVADKQNDASAKANPAIYEALSQLDQANDDHWTDEGLPSVEAVQEFVTEFGRGELTVSRETINSAAPGFTRAIAPFQGTAAAEYQASMENVSLDELIKSNADISGLNDTINSLYAERDRLINEIKEAEQRRDRIIVRLQKQAKENPAHAFAETRRYLEGQQRLREQGRRRAPVDVAMMSAPRQYPRR